MSINLTATNAEIVEEINRKDIFIDGTGLGTAAVTSSPYSCAKWVGSNAAIKSLYSGLLVWFKIGVAGNGTYGTSLNINSLGEHPVIANASTMIGTLYGVGSIIPLIYDADASGSIYKNSASSTSVSGVWKISEADLNTYLPLSAGSGKSLTGDLVTSKSIYLTNITGSINDATSSRLYFGSYSSPYSWLASNSSKAFSLATSNGAFVFYPNTGTYNCLISNCGSNLGRNDANGSYAWNHYYTKGKIYSHKGGSNGFYELSFPAKNGTFALTDDIPTKTSDLTNDSGFITDAGVTSVSLSQGSSNGTVKLTVNGTDGSDVSVKGLGSAAYKSTGTSSGNVPVLDSNGKLDSSIIPAVAITDTFTASSQADMLALSSAQKGDICIRTDENKTYVLSADGYSTLSNWKELLSPTSAGGGVTSVNSKTGAVTLTASDVGAEAAFTDGGAYVASVSNYRVTIPKYIKQDGGKISVPNTWDGSNNNITLHRVAMTGSYNDLSDKPTGMSVDSSLDASSNNAVANSAVTPALSSVKFQLLLANYDFDNSVYVAYMDVSEGALTEGKQYFYLVFFPEYESGVEPNLDAPLFIVDVDAPFRVLIPSTITETMGTSASVLAQQNYYVYPYVYKGYTGAVLGFVGTAFPDLGCVLVNTQNLANYQPSTDNSLLTTSKTVVGAINEAAGAAVLAQTTASAALPKIGGNVTGDLVLYNSSNGSSPRLTFQRGTLTDNYNDWSMYDSGGLFYIQQRGSGSSAWETRVTITQSVANFAGTLQQGGSAVATQSWANSTFLTSTSSALKKYATRTEVYTDNRIIATFVTTSANTQISLYFETVSSIDWGDGTVDTPSSSSITHTYSTAGTYICYIYGVTAIDNGAFYDMTTLKTIRIPDNVTTIGVSCFQDCSGLTTVYLGKGITTINQGAFYQCSALSRIYYNGSANDWDKISIDLNAYIDTATIYFLTETGGVIDKSASSTISINYTDYLYYRDYVLQISQNTAGIPSTLSLSGNTYCILSTKSCTPSGLPNGSNALANYAYQELIVPAKSKKYYRYVSYAGSVIGWQFGTWNEPATTADIASAITTALNTPV